VPCQGAAGDFHYQTCTKKISGFLNLRKKNISEISPD
jgi:hypothetical protein